MRKRIAWGIVGLVSLLFAGCDNPPAQQIIPLEAELEAASGQVGARTIRASELTLVQAERIQNRAVFGLQSEEGLDMTLTVCPVGELDTDPYGTGDGRLLDAGLPPDGEGGSSPELPPACEDNELAVCADGDCVLFEADDMKVEIRDAVEWRTIEADVEGNDGAVHLSLRYREAG